MKTKTSITLLVAFVVALILFLVVSSIFLIGTYSNAALKGNEYVGALSWINWMWIPTVLSLGLIFIFGWAVFSGKMEKNKVD
jgi:hypothetical protein